MKSFEKYEHSVLAVCERLHGCDTGSGDGMAHDEREELIDWLRWRVKEAWDESRDPYDACVQMLAIATLEMTDCTDAGGQFRLPTITSMERSGAKLTIRFK